MYLCVFACRVSHSSRLRCRSNFTDGHPADDPDPGRAHRRRVGAVLGGGDHRRGHEATRPRRRGRVGEGDGGAHRHRRQQQATAKHHVAGRGRPRAERQEQQSGQGHRLGLE